MVLQYVCSGSTSRSRGMPGSLQFVLPEFRQPSVLRQWPDFRLKAEE
jgi:hypothetical protein